MIEERAAKIILDMINGAESTLGHSLSTLEINALKKGYCALNPEPTTNAEHIRAMTDEELAKYLAWLEDVEACYQWEMYGDADRITEWLDWLKQEVANKEGK